MKATRRRQKMKVASIKVHIYDEGDRGRGGWGEEDEHVGGGRERNICTVPVSWSQEVVMVIVR